MHWSRLRRKARPTGSALIVVLVLVAVMAIYVFSNAATLHRLRKRLDLVEQRHEKRWRKRAAATRHTPPDKTPSAPAPAPPKG